jgi:hypothetical protein
MPIDPDQLNKFNNILDDVSPELVEEAVRGRFTRQGAMTFLKGSHVTTFFQNRVGCKNALIWIIGGQASTNRSGEATIHLNQYLCLSHDEESEANIYFPSILSAPNFVTTPRSSTPILATTSVTLEAIDLGGVFPRDIDSSGEFPETLDVKVKVMTWKLDGNKAPNVKFDWNCIMDGTRWSVIPG